MENGKRFRNELCGCHTLDASLGIRVIRECFSISLYNIIVMFSEVNECQQCLICAKTLISTCAQIEYVKNSRLSEKNDHTQHTL